MNRRQERKRMMKAREQSRKARDCNNEMIRNLSNSLPENQGPATVRYDHATPFLPGGAIRQGNFQAYIVGQNQMYTDLMRSMRSTSAPVSPGGIWIDLTRAPGPDPWSVSSCDFAFHSPIVFAWVSEQMTRCVKHGRLALSEFQNMCCFAVPALVNTLWYEFAVSDQRLMIRQVAERLGFLDGEFISLPVDHPYA